MFDLSSSLPTRLRRHRGLWALTMAVMLIKLVTSTVCLADAPEAQVASTANISTVIPVMATVTGDVSADNAVVCLLGEGSSCHCACAETVTFPTVAPGPIAKVVARNNSFAIRSGFTSATPGTLLRPPIA